MGCRIILVALFAVVLLLGLAGVALFHYAGVYSLLIIPVVAVAAYFLGKRALIQLFLIPFQLKGKVLKGASATIHEVSFVGIEEVDADEDKKEKQFAYLIDVTITPGSATTPFKMWDPYELCIVAPDAKAPSLKEDPTDGSFGDVFRVSVFDNGQWQDEDFDKLHGPARIRLKIRLIKPCAACKLRYYFYDITKIELPPVPELTPPATATESTSPA